MGRAAKSDELLTTGQAAERLGVTPGRVRQFVARGQIATVRVGHLSLIPASAVAAHVRGAGGRKPPGPKR